MQKTREVIREDILGLQAKQLLCILPTSTGKSKIALDYLNEHKVNGPILIVIPRLVLIQNWKDEITKWSYQSMLDQVQFSTYVSLPKLANQSFSAVIYDEAHHLTERALVGAESIKTEFTILLSATIKREQKQVFKSLWPKLKVYEISMKQAFDDSILPDPQIKLVPLQLDNQLVNQTITKNPKAKGEPVIVSYKQRFIKDKNHKYLIRCTQQQYYDDLSYWVDKYKRMYMSSCNKSLYFLWQQKAGERLKWLAMQKNNYAKLIINKLKTNRTLTFCTNIEQTELLGEYCVNSKEANSTNYIEQFNNGVINHITACNMLNEGINLVNCQVGIFVAINSSEIMKIQKVGRLLRHQHPIIYLIYYKNTREEEIVKEMLTNYNPELISELVLESNEDYNR